MSEAEAEARRPMEEVGQGAGAAAAARTLGQTGRATQIRTSGGDTTL